MIRLTRRYRFVASHRLHSPLLSEPDNDTTYGKCNNPYGHGHNYTLEVSVENQVDPVTGQSVPVPLLDTFVQQQVISRYDHRNMNEELAEYQHGLVPTTENVLACIEEQVRQIWPRQLGSLVRLRLHETANNTFESQIRMNPNEAVLDILPTPPQESSPSVTSALAGHVQGILDKLGEDSGRDGLLRTPERAAKAMQYLTSGYQTDLKTIVNGALFDVDYDEMVIVRDIEFYSLCEHHMLPFYGKAHVAYLPSKKVIGLSKIPRVVDMFARRLQVQERLTQQIAETLQDILQPQGVGVILEARHFCMMMRGVEKQNSGTVTSAMLGAFREKETRSEFLSLVHTSGNHCV